MSDWWQIRSPEPGEGCAGCLVQFFNLCGGLAIVIFLFRSASKDGMLNAEQIQPQITYVNQDMYTDPHKQHDTTELFNTKGNLNNFKLYQEIQHAWHEKTVQHTR